MLIASWASAQVTLSFYASSDVLRYRENVQEGRAPIIKLLKTPDI